MGRKSRKKPHFKLKDMPELSPELMEQFKLNKYLTPEELYEIEGCILFYGYYFFMDIDGGAPGGGSYIISEETIMEINGSYLDPELVLNDYDLVRACLTAEALKKDCVNLLFYARLLRMCMDEIDYETHWPILVDPVMRDRIKRYMHTELTFNKSGIFVNFGLPDTESESPMNKTETMTLVFDDI